MIERYGHQMTWVGGYGGWGGMIHTWTHLGHLWDEEPWRAEAWEMVDRLPQLLADDECFDVLAGSAGAIRPLLTFGRWTGDPRPGRLAVEMGDYLLEHAMPCPRGIGWGVDISPQVPLTGFSHGAAGFTCALADLYAASGETRFRDAALETKTYGLAKAKEGFLRLGRETRAMLEGLGFTSVSAPGFQAPGVVVSYTDDPKMVAKLKALGIQVAAGVPFMLDERKGLVTFRVGLFGIDKVYDIPRTVGLLKEALEQIKRDAEEGEL